MKEPIPKFESVAARCTEKISQLEEDKQTFFNDNLRLYSSYMTHLSKTLYYYVLAYKNQKDKNELVKNLELAYTEANLAQQFLIEGQHGIFSTWHSNADPLTRTFQRGSLIEMISLLKQQALIRIR